jgi:hypothetical protein
MEIIKIITTSRDFEHKGMNHYFLDEAAIYSYSPFLYFEIKDLICAVRYKLLIGQPSILQ